MIVSMSSLCWALSGTVNKQDWSMFELPREFRRRRLEVAKMSRQPAKKDKNGRFHLHTFNS